MRVVVGSSLHEKDGSALLGEERWKGFKMGVGSVLLVKEGVALLTLVQRMITPMFSVAEVSVIQAPAWELTVMPKFTSSSSGRLAIH